MTPRKLGQPTSRKLPAGETMILSADDSQAVVLNAVGAAVWHLVNGRRTVEEIATVILDRFSGVTLGQVRADITELLEKLTEAGLIEA